MTELIVAPSGACRCVYTEALDLFSLGDLDIRRASRVEPDPYGLWWADLTPVNGPKLGPWRRRADALVAEATWLSQHWLTRPSRRGHHCPRIPVRKEVFMRAGLIVAALALLIAVGIGIADRGCSLRSRGKSPAPAHKPSQEVRSHAEQVDPDR